MRRVLSNAVRRLDRFEHRPGMLSAIAAGVSLVAAAGMAASAGLTAVGTAFEALAPEWLAVAAAARIVALAGYTVAHHRVMSACGDAELSAESPAVVAFGGGATSLKGGFAIDRRALRGAGASRHQASVHVLTLGLLEYVVLAPATWACALVLLGSRGVEAAVTWPWLLGVPTGAIAAAGLYWRLAPRLAPGERRPRAALARPLEAARVLLRAARVPDRGAAAVLGMAVHWFAEVLCLWASLRAFGISKNLDVVTLGFATGLVLTPRTLPLAGAGIVEILLPLSLMWVGVPLAGAVVAVLAAELTRLLVHLPLALAAEDRVRELVESG